MLDTSGRTHHPNLLPLVLLAETESRLFLWVCTVAKQKIEKSFDRDYAPVVLWLDDIIAIYERSKESAKDVEISNSDYKFETPVADVVAGYRSSMLRIVQERVM
jgi:hypothetical protein